MTFCKSVSNIKRIKKFIFHLIMILVTGATGHLGTAVIETLLKKESANNIAAFVRNESKAADLKEKGVSIRVGNYDDFDY